MRQNEFLANRRAARAVAANPPVFNPDLIPPPGESLPPEEPIRARDYGFTEDELEFLMENTIKPREGRSGEGEEA